jgi:YHS domain-containing protein
MLTRILFLVAAFAFSGAGVAQKPEVYSDSGTAIRGYDPVAYFTSGAPVKGSKEFTAQWRGATWHFASAENRDRFAQAPEKYAPQYGGYCAYGVSQGYTVSIDPAAWTVVDGKLYLNYSASVRRTWEKDIPGYIRKADGNWPKALER